MSARTGTKRAVNSRNPEKTKQTILAAATEAFSKKGLSGARVDEIAADAKSNKRMIYHYFGNKEGLYLAVLEQVYAGIRASENELNLQGLDPEEGMRELIFSTWDYQKTHPEFISLLNIENLHKAEFLKKSKIIKKMHSPLVQNIESLLERGVAEGKFVRGVDPVQLYISIASLGYFYVQNAYTLSTIFNRNLLSKAALKERKEHIVEVILAYLRSGK